MKMMIMILKMIANTTKKTTRLQKISILIKIAQLPPKLIKNYNLKKIDKDLNIILNLLFTAILIKISKNWIKSKLMNYKAKTIQ
jgi:hypothetical protein